MPEKYLYNGKIVDSKEIEDAAKQSNLDIKSYTQKAGIKTIQDSYNYNGKSYSAEDVVNAASQSNMDFDAYVKKAGFNIAEPVEKKNVVSPPTAKELDINYGTKLNNTEEADPVTLAKQADALSKETVETNTGGAAALMGGVTSQRVPKTESVNKANEIYGNLEKLGYNGKELAKDMADIPDFVFNQKGFTKGEILDDYKNNKPLYVRKVATATWQPLLMKQLKEAQTNPDLKHDAFVASEDLGAALNTIDIDGDYASQRDLLNKITNIANKFGGDNKDKILRNLGVDISYIYGKAASDPDFIMQNAGSKLNNLQAVATNYLQDIHPEELRKYTSAFLKDEDIKDNDAAKLAKEEASKRLEELGMQLSKSYLQEKLNPIQKEYQPLWDKSQKEPLSPDELSRAKQLEEAGAPYQQQLEMLNEDEKTLGEKYPTATGYDAYNFAQELVGQRQNWLEHLMAKTGEATSNTAAGVYDFVGEPFRTEQDSQLRQAEVLGEGIRNRTSTYVSDISGKPELSPELKAEVEKIKNDKSLSYDQRLKATTDLLVKRNGEWYTNNKESNLSLKSLGYGITDLAAGLVPFMGLEMLTGGGATAGAVRKFTSTFVSAAATSFEDSYREGLEKGVKNPYAYATRVTAINSAAIAGAATPDKIRAIFSKQKTAIGDLVMKMTDSEIEAALKEAPKALKSFKGVLDAAKGKLVGAGKVALSSFGDAAKINAAMSAGKIANDAISGELKTPVEYAKDFALETLKFGLFSIGGKTVSKLVKPTDIGLANLYDAAKNKDAIFLHLDEKVKDGTISQNDAAEIRSNVESAAKIINKSPFFKSLDDKAKREYLYNSLVEQKNKEAAAGLPEKQAEKYDIAAQVAQHKNALLVDPKTPEQLEKRKVQLEKILEPPTVDEKNGKSEELSDNARLNAKAEMQAIDEVLEEHKKANEAGEGLTKEEQNAVDVISKGDFNTEDGKRVKIWTDIISDPNTSAKDKKQALKELGEQLADKNSETETGLALGKAADAVYSVNDANGVKVEGIAPPKVTEGKVEEIDLIGKTSSELNALSKEAKDKMRKQEDEILGDKVKEYREAKAYGDTETIDRIEKSLTKEQADIFFGKGQAALEPNEINKIATRVSTVEQAENVNDLAQSAKLALIDLAVGKNEMESKAVLDAVKRKAEELGIDTNELTQEALKAAGGKFSSKEDAMEILGKYFNPKVEKNGEEKIEIPKSTKEGGITDEGTDKESGAAKEGEDGGGKEPPKVEEGKEEKGRFKDKGILNRLNSAENVPAHAKEGFAEKGLKYEVQTKDEAAAVGKAMVEQYGIEDALDLAGMGKFKGGVNSAIFAEALNKIYEQEQSATTPEAKLQAAKDFAEASIRYDEYARKQGRDISQISFFYKKSPLGVKLAEEARRSEAFKDFAKNKEKSWKEVFDELVKEPEFEQEFKAHVKEELKKERAEARAKRIKKVDAFFDEAKSKFKGGAAYSTIIPP